MPKLRNGSKGDSNPGFLDCESGILPLSYRAPLILKTGVHTQDWEHYGFVVSHTVYISDIPYMFKLFSSHYM